MAVPVWKQVECAILCWQNDLALADLLWRHERLWSLLQESTELREFHEIRCVIAMYDAAGGQPEELLRDQLRVTNLDGSAGYSVWKRTTGLAMLLNLVASSRTTTSRHWTRRKEGDPGYRLLVNLQIELKEGKTQSVIHAASRAWNHFEARQAHLDYYCEPPRHSNGNEWRKWLRRTVTEPVTPDIVETGRALLPRLNVI